MNVSMASRSFLASLRSRLRCRRRPPRVSQDPTEPIRRSQDQIDSRLRRLYRVSHLLSLPDTSAMTVAISAARDCVRPLATTSQQRR
ncbi:hypothetical protein C9J85_16540 [Haloferax sp. wsp5]|nr:hypothetical protein C9J85_16540 [Haloferax sp. wsp5]